MRKLSTFINEYFCRFAIFWTRIKSKITQVAKAMSKSKVAITPGLKPNYEIIADTLKIKTHQLDIINSIVLIHLNSNDNYGDNGLLQNHQI